MAFDFGVGGVRFSGHLKDARMNPRFYPALAAAYGHRAKERPDKIG